MGVRAIAETLSRNLVFRRSFSARFGHARIVITPEAGLKYWRLNVDRTDPVLLSAVAHLVKPGSVVWDIGANVGLFSVAAAALSGAQGLVLSVDADEWLMSLVRRSIELNGKRIAPIHQVTTAVSDREGVSQFHIARRSRSSNFLAGCGASQTGGTREVRTVPATTLDRLAEQYPPPDVVKIDVEGAELLVLEGGRKILAKTRPALFCEVSPENADGVTRLLTQELGYDLFDISAGWDRPTLVQRAVWNTLAIRRRDSGD